MESARLLAFSFLPGTISSEALRASVASLSVASLSVASLSELWELKVAMVCIDTSPPVILFLQFLTPLSV